MRTFLLIAGLLVYPFAVHGLVTFGAAPAAVAGLLLICLLNWLVAVRAGPAARRWAWLYAALAALAAASLYSATAYALFVPPIAINLGLMLLFAAGLRRGATPLIERLMRLEYGAALPAPLVRYARQLTVVWTAFFAIVIAISLVLAFSAPLAWWSWFTNVAIYLLLTLLFVAQYAYRYVRFRQFGVFMPWHLARDLARTPISDPAHPFFHGTAK